MLAMPREDPTVPDSRPLSYRVARLLADGAWHSGQVLGRRLGVSRAAVSKAVARLCADGLAVERARGRGYRLPAPLEPLEPAAIRRAAGQSQLPLYVLPQVDSTNDQLWRLVERGRVVSGTACLAEVQRAGRGRRGRSWQATPYRNIMFSLAWRFSRGGGEVSGLSLAAGVAVAEALEGQGTAGLGLKWPNDLYLGERKLGGLLVELRGEASGPCWVVVGVGLNLAIETIAARAIDRPWTCLAAAGDPVPGRNVLAGLLWRHLLSACQEFEVYGLAPFRPRWERRHLLAGRRVTIQTHGGVLEGRVEGTDDNGALLLRDAAGRLHHLLAGEVSLGALP